MINPEYLRKTTIAAQMADASFLLGGLTGMQNELAFLRGSNANAVLIAEFERLYHKQCRKSYNRNSI